MKEELIREIEKAKKENERLKKMNRIAENIKNNELKNATLVREKNEKLKEELIEQYEINKYYSETENIY